MATPKETQEGKINRAEAAATLRTKAEAAEQAEGARNEAEAARAQERRTDRHDTADTDVAGHNAWNRQISRMLRASRAGVNANMLREENRKLKNQVRRMMNGQSAQLADSPPDITPGIVRVLSSGGSVTPFALPPAIGLHFGIRPQGWPHVFTCRRRFHACRGEQLRQP